VPGRIGWGLKSGLGCRKRATVHQYRTAIFATEYQFFPKQNEKYYLCASKSIENILSLLPLKIS
jgi:hypothetical protein